jgi:hypothetical protein
MFKDHFTKIIQEFQANPERIDELADSLKGFKSALEEVVLPIGTPPHPELRAGAQSKQFMMQLLPIVQKYMRAYPYAHRFNILDVGPGTGHGSQLLASMYQTGQLGYRARVVTTDVAPHYVNYMKLFCPNTAPIQKDIFRIDSFYDIVIASHVIEHVRDWKGFVRQLQRISSGIVVLCAPLEEDAREMTNGHVNIFKKSDFDDFDVISFEVAMSPAWGQFRSPPYEMFIATLRGDHSDS